MGIVAFLCCSVLYWGVGAIIAGVSVRCAAVGAKAPSPPFLQVLIPKVFTGADLRSAHFKGTYERAISAKNLQTRNCLTSVETKCTYDFFGRGINQLGKIERRSLPE
jgi:hypothetical protein